MSSYKELDPQLKELYRKLYESQKLTNIGSWSWEIEQNKVEWSDQMFTILGITPQSVEPSYELSLSHVYDDDKVEYEEKLNQSLQAKTSYYLENRIIKTDGSFRSVISRGDFNLDDQGEIIRMFGTVQDVTDQKNLIESNTQLKHFAEILAHDFKSPLRTIVSFTTLLRKKLNLQDVNVKELQYLDFIQSAGNDLFELVDDILVGSNVAANKTDLRQISLQPLIQSVIDSLRQRIDEKNAIISIGDLTEIVLGHKTKLRRVFQNLIENALKYSNDDRRCAIEIRYVKEELVDIFIIKDNGIGVSNKYRADIFDLHKKTLRGQNYPGIGAGLHICKQIIDNHRGKIWLERSDQNGSEFRFSLPREE